MLSSPFARVFFRSVGIASAAFAAGNLAHAQLSGVVYENDFLYSTDADDGPSFDPVYYANLPSADFTSSGINYQSQVTGYTVAEFLNSPTFTNPMNGFNSANTIDDSFVVLTGTIYLNSGLNSFVVAHDDGVTITINGIGNVIDQPGPTGEDFSPFDVTAPSAGDYTFTLDYTECCGPPADLVWDINQKVVGAPDSSSAWLLMGLGVGSLAALRRKLAPRPA